MRSEKWACSVCDTNSHSAYQAHVHLRFINDATARSPAQPTNLRVATGELKALKSACQLPTVRASAM